MFEAVARSPQETELPLTRKDYVRSHQHDTIDAAPLQQCARAKRSAASSITEACGTGCGLIDLNLSATFASIGEASTTGAGISSSMGAAGSSVGGASASDTSAVQPANEGRTRCSSGVAFLTFPPDLSPAALRAKAVSFIETSPDRSYTDDLALPAPSPSRQRTLDN